MFTRLSFYQTVKFSILRIYDFDKTLTIRASFAVETDDLSVRKNTKKDIAVRLADDSGIFAVCSYIDSPDNIVRYLASIFSKNPQLIEQKDIEVFCKLRQKKVHTFTLTVVSLPGLPYPICITTLPQRTNEIDEVTGEKNIAYRMAREALKENHQKNLPMQTIIQYYLDCKLLNLINPTIQFYDDDRTNVEEALNLHLDNTALQVESYYVSPGIDFFEAQQVQPERADSLEQ